MAGEPIRFRCTQCGKLLGVSRSRAGSFVACPKCSAPLVVPAADAAPEPPPPPTVPSAPLLPEPPKLTTGTASWPASGVISGESGLSLELLDIRPEDIRAKGGVEPLSPFVATAASFQVPETAFEMPLPGAELTSAAGPVGQEAEIVPDTIFPLSEPAAPVVPPVPPPPPRPAPAVRTAPPIPPAPVRTPPASPVPPVPTSPPPVPPASDTVSTPAPATADVVIPPIRLDEELPGPRSRQPVPARPRDLVLPRSVVTAWSMFVLLALAMAFVAGLLLGHYVWKAH